MQETIDNNIIQNDINKSNPNLLPRTLLPWFIWLIGTGFVVFQFQLQLCSGPMIENLMESFSITAFGAGILSSTYYYIYVLMQIPAGMLIDRYGARRLLTMGSLVCAFGCFTFALSHYLIFAEIGRVCMGGGSAFAFVGALFLIGKWFPASRFAFLIGLSDMIGALSSMFGNVALAAAVQHFDWRDSMICAGIIALILAALNFFVVKDNPPGKNDQIKKVDLLAFKKQIKLLLSDSDLWLHGLYIGILFATVCVFSGLWAIPFIRLQQHVSNTTATFLASITFVGLGVSCPIMGWLFSRIKRPKRMLSGCALIATLTTTIAIYFPPQSLIAYAALLFLMGVVISVYVFNFGLVQKRVRPEIKSSAMGFLNTLCVVTVPIFQPLVGFLLHHNSSHQMINGREIYTILNYQYALAVIPLALFLAAMIPYFLRFEGERSEDDSDNLVLEMAT